MTSQQPSGGAPLHDEPRLWTVAAPIVMLVGLTDLSLGFRADGAAVVAQWIAAELDLAEAEQEEIATAAQLRDVGMLAVLRFTTKPSPLSDDERRHVQHHPIISEDCAAHLAKIEPRFEAIATIVRHHHERWDGKGYPDGLSEAAIPLSSRILGVADAFTAMRFGSMVRDRLPKRVARLRLAQAAATQFDPTVVAAFERVVQRQREGQPLDEWRHVVYPGLGHNLLAE